MNLVLIIVPHIEISILIIISQYGYQQVDMAIMNLSYGSY